jgi:hypothetical protein
MTGSVWLDMIISVTAALLPSWLTLIVALAIRCAKGNCLRKRCAFSLIFRVFHVSAIDLPLGFRGACGKIVGCYCHAVTPGCLFIAGCPSAPSGHHPTRKSYQPLNGRNPGIGDAACI